MPTLSVHVRGLTQSYGDFQAVKGADVESFPAEVFGLLGPNGTGKTSTVEILEGLRSRDGGDAASAKASTKGRGSHRRDGVSHSERLASAAGAR